jgi:hypothetical protein
MQPVHASAPVVITEAAPPVPDAEYADPLNVDTLKREQMLGVRPEAVVDPRAEYTATSGYYDDLKPAEKLAINVENAKDEKKTSRFSIEGGAAGIYTKVNE